MEVLLVTLHVLTCLALILIVLLQHGKGADIGVQFGSSQTVFGARGAGNFLTKLTTGAAVVFMVTSFLLSKLSERSDLSEILEEPAAAEQAAPPATPGSAAEAQPVEGEPGSIPGFEQIEPPAAGVEPEPGSAPQAEPPAPAPAPAADR